MENNSNKRVIVFFMICGLFWSLAYGCFLDFGCFLVLLNRNSVILIIKRQNDYCFSKVYFFYNIIQKTLIIFLIFIKISDFICIFPMFITNFISIAHKRNNNVCFYKYGCTL